MTFWMLAGLSFTYKSYIIHGVIDYGSYHQLAAAPPLYVCGCTPNCNCKAIDRVSVAKHALSSFYYIFG